MFPGPLGRAQDGRACVYIANYCLFVRDGKTGETCLWGHRKIPSASSKRLSCWAEARHCGGYTVLLSGWQGHGRAATVTLFCGSLLWSLLQGKPWLGEKPDYIKHLTRNLYCLEAQNYDRSDTAGFPTETPAETVPTVGNPQRAFVMRVEAASSSF